MMIGDDIREEIASYLIEEFGKNNLTAVKRKPLLLKWQEHNKYFNNEFTSDIAETPAHNRYIPSFNALVISKSNYAKTVIKDINQIYTYLRNLYLSNENDTTTTTFETISYHTGLKNYNRIDECLYYLNNSTGFTTYSINRTGESIEIDKNKEIYINDYIMEYKQFNDYLTWFYEVNKKYYIQTNTINLDAYKTNLLEILIDVKEKYFDNRKNPIGRDDLLSILENKYNITTEINRVSIYNVLSPHKK